MILSLYTLTSRGEPMSFLPRDFVVPTLLETEYFRIRPITIHDVIKDFEAVMTSRHHLWNLFGEGWGWPPEDMTLEQNLIDLGWHQKEFQLRSSFDYAVMSLDEKRLLGCVYVDPPSQPEYDAEAFYWIREDALAQGLEEKLGELIRAWLVEIWPFSRVAYPGRDINWKEWYGEA